MTETHIAVAEPPQSGNRNAVIPATGEAGGIAHLIPRQAITLLKMMVDPILDRIDEALNRAQIAIVAARTSPGIYAFDEAGDKVNDSEAWELCEYENHLVNSDEIAGLTHHKRADAWLVVFGRLAPFMEALGCLVMLQAWFNVDLIRPWTNWFAWTATVVIVITVSVVQKLTSESAGKSHNAARQQTAERHEVMAANHRRTRNWMLVFAGFIACFISASLAVRGIQSMGIPEWWQIVLVAVASTITGIGTGALSYFAVAVDGSIHRRRYDELSAQGEAAAAEQDDDINEATDALTEAANDDETVYATILPGIVEDIRQSFHGSPEETVESLKPVAERVHRLEAQRARRQELEAELAKVPRRAFWRAA